MQIAYGSAIMSSLLILTGCAPSPEGRVSSRLKGLAAVDRAKNIAVIGSGAGPGVSSSNAFKVDIKKMAEVLGAAPFNFEIRMHADARMDTLAQEVAKAAEALGEDGSLLFFFSGHGSPGFIYKGDDSMSSSQLNAAAAHGNYARFTAIIESCESGSFARGGKALQVKPNFKSMLVLAAAKGNEESADNGTDSYFPHYMEKYLVELAKNSSATVGDLAQKVFQAAKAGNPGQSGEMSAIPESILKEPVFSAEGGPTPSATGIFVALGAASSTQEAQTIFASIPSATGSTVALCPGIAAECQSVPQTDSRLVLMDFASQSGGRMIYRSRSGVRLDMQPNQTVMVYSGSNASQPSQRKSVRFKSKTGAY